MTISVCWRKLAFPWTTEKEKKYKVGEVNEPQQSGLLPDRLSSSLSSCFQTTSLLIGEVSIEEKMWFSPEYMCISSVSGVHCTLFRPIQVTIFTGAEYRVFDDSVYYQNQCRIDYIG
ncbi:hypothetical protein V6N11_022821 [Hibiscus sabdariffa]|uniref:Uncharacterized protein n=1 Tax=Hibiscus sabdariffa TaxID=183260 RepID=A0ABR2TKB7_9ROSI